MVTQQTLVWGDKVGEGDRLANLYWIAGFDLYRNDSGFVVTIGSMLAAKWFVFIGAFVSVWFVSAAVMAEAAPQKKPAPEEERWTVVVSSITDNPPDAVRTLQVQLEQDLTIRGIRVRGIFEAKAEFEKRFGATPVRLPDELRPRLSKTLNEVSMLNKKRRWPRMVEVGQKYIQIAMPHIHQLARDNFAASEIGMLCLYVVQAYVGMHREVEADAQASRCIATIPDFTPNESTFSPEIRARLTSARERATRSQQGVLSITTESPGLPPKQCNVRINGRNIGTTPLTDIRLPEGTYALQVECEPGRIGKVRQVTLGGWGIVKLVVNVPFEGALYTDDGTWLVYPDDATRKAREPGDLALLTDLLGANRVIRLVQDHPDEGLIYLLDKVPPQSTSPQARAGFKISKPARAEFKNENAIIPEEAHALLNSLLEARRTGTAATTTIPVVAASATGAAGMGGASAAAAPSAPSAAAKPAASQEHQAAAAQNADEPHRVELSTTSRIAGYSMLGVGVASSVLAWILYADWAHIKSYTDSSDPTDPNWDSLVAQRNARRTQTLVAGGIGAGLIALSYPFWLPDNDTALYGSIAAGVAGATMVTIGAIQWSKNGACSNPPTCTSLEQKVPLGPLLVMEGSSLILAPVVFGIRRLFAPGASKKETPFMPLASYDAQNRGVRLSLSGRF